MDLLEENQHNEDVRSEKEKPPLTKGSGKTKDEGKKRTKKLKKKKKGSSSKVQGIGGEEMSQTTNSPVKKKKKEKKKDRRTKSAAPTPSFSSYANKDAYRQRGSTTDTTDPVDVTSTSAADTSTSPYQDTSGRMVGPGAFRVTNIMERGEGGNANENNNSIENEEYYDDDDDDLIKAELVEDKDVEEAEVFNLDSERRNRRIIFTIVTVIVAAIVVGITVPVVNNNNNNDADDNGGTQIVVIVPTQAPSISEAPTKYPTQTPTSLLWQQVIAPGQQQLNGLDPVLLSNSSQLIGGGLVGTQVNILDIQNTPLGERTNRTTMLLLGMGGVQKYATRGAPLPDIFSNYVYLCEDTMNLVAETNSNDFNATQQDYCEFASQLGIFSHGRPTAVSFPLFLEQRDNGDLVLYNLTNVDSTQAEGKILASEQPMARSMSILNEAGDEIIHMTFDQICQQRFASFFPGMPSTLVSDSCISAKPQEFVDGFPILDPTIKRFYAFDMAGDVIVIFLAISFGPCTFCSLYKSYNVITLSRSPPLTEVAPQLETNIMEDVDFDHAAVALNGNGTIMAYSIVDREYTTAKQNFVAVYRMEDSTWVPMGSRLVGKEGGGDEFGYSLSFSDSGTMLAIGARTDDVNGVDSGRVYIYEWENGEWTLSGDLLGESGSHFGHSVDLHPFQNQILVGAPKSRTNGEDAGLAHLYHLVSE